VGPLLSTGVFVGAYYLLGTRKYELVQLEGRGTSTTIMGQFESRREKVDRLPRG
jgi:hypothetical protein